MYKKVYQVVIWAIVTILLVNTSFALMNMSSTIAVIVGVFLLTSTVIMSIATKCLTKIVSKRK